MEESKQTTSEIFRNIFNNQIDSSKYWFINNKASERHNIQTRSGSSIGKAISACLIDSNNEKAFPQLKINKSDFIVNMQLISPLKEIMARYQLTCKLAMMKLIEKQADQLKHWKLCEQMPMTNYSNKPEDNLQVKFECTQINNEYFSLIFDFKQDDPAIRITGDKLFVLNDLEAIDEMHDLVKYINYLIANNSGSEK